MKIISKYLSAVVITLGTLASPASALIVESISISAQSSIDGSNVLDVSNPVATAPNTKDLVGPGGVVDVATGFALQNENGISQVESKVTHIGIDGLGANGTLDEHTVRSSAIRFVTYTNTSTTTSYAGRFDFIVSGGFLETYNGGGGSIDPTAFIRFFAASDIDDFRAEMTLTGSYNSHTITQQQNFSGSVVDFDCYASTCLGGRVNVDTLTGSIDIGVLAPGETALVTTALVSENTWNGTEIGSIARIRDPNALMPFSATFTPVGTVSAVPLPAGGMLLLTLLGAGALASRRKRSVMPPADASCAHSARHIEFSTTEVIHSGTGGQ